MLPPKRVTCEELGCVFTALYYLAVRLGGGIPDPLPSFFRAPRGFRAQRRTVPGHQDTTVPGRQDPGITGVLELWNSGPQDPRTPTPAAAV